MECPARERCQVCQQYNVSSPHREVSNPRSLKWANHVSSSHCKVSNTMFLSLNVRWPNHVSSPHREVSNPRFFLSLWGEQYNVPFPYLWGEKITFIPFLVRWANHVSSPHREVSNTMFLPLIVRWANLVFSPKLWGGKPCFFLLLWGEQTTFLLLIVRWANLVSSPLREVNKPCGYSHLEVKPCFFSSL